MTFDKINTNIPLAELLSYREVGYIDLVLEELFKIRTFEEYEFFLYFRLSSHTEPVKIPPTSKKQIVFIVSDESLYVPNELKEQAFAIFRHYLPESSVKGNMFHLPVGYSRAFKMQSLIPFYERKINVFFSGNLHVGRAKLFKYLTKLYFLPFAILHRIQSLLNNNYDYKFPQSFIRFSKGFHNGLSPEEYTQKLCNSKIILCPPGLENVETMRLFESMKAGCIIISESLPRFFCYMDSPIITVNHWSELDSLIPELLSNPNRMEELHKKTIEWWQTHGSEKATAKYIDACIRSLEEQAVLV